MSRHLMAKFRRQAAPVQWNNGPAGWVHWAEKWNEPHEHEHATVYHHEQPFSLEIMPSRTHPRSNGIASVKPYAWSWGIFMHGHDKRLAEDGIPQDSEWIHPGNWKDKHAPGMEYVGEAPSPEEAKEAAERAWEDHKRAVGGALADGDMPDYEKLVNPRDDLDDDFGDIFGGGR